MQSIIPLLRPLLLLSLVGGLSPLLSHSWAGNSKLLVTVTDERGVPVTNLKADSFSVDDRVERNVLSAEYTPDAVDMAVLLDTSAFTESSKHDIERIGVLLVDAMGKGEKMSVLSFAGTAELLQDLTSNKQSLVGAVSGANYGNAVKLIDSMYAALDTAFQNSSGRKVLLVVSSGNEGINAVKKSEIIDLAETRHATILAVSLSGRPAVLEDVTHDTGGILLNGRELKPLEQAAKNLFACVRGHYELTLDGGELTDKLRVEVKTSGKEKLQVSYRRE